MSSQNPTPPNKLLSRLFTNLWKSLQTRVQTSSATYLLKLKIRSRKKERKKNHPQKENYSTEKDRKDLSIKVFPSRGLETRPLTVSLRGSRYRLLSAVTTAILEWVGVHMYYAEGLWKEIYLLFKYYQRGCFLEAISFSVLYFGVFECRCAFVVFLSLFFLLEILSLAYWNGMEWQLCWNWIK